MTPNLKISNSVVNRLSTIKTQCSGKLYGILFKNTLLVIGVSIEKEKNIDITNSFPTEIDLCGVVDIGKGVYEEQHINKAFEDIDVTDNPIYVSCKIGNPNNLSAHFVINDRLQNTTFEEMNEQEIYSQFVHIRLKAQLPFICELTQDSVKDMAHTMRKLFSSGRMAFNFPKTNIYLMGNDNESGIIGLTGNPNMNELCDESSDSNEGVIVRKKKTNSLEMVVISVNMFKRVTVEGTSSFTKQHGPIFILDKRSRKSLVLSIPIDTLAMVHRETKLIKLYEILLESSIRNLRLFESSLLKQLETIENSGNISAPEVYHFFPEGCGHYFTRIYFKNEDEKLLRSERNLLHQQLVLPVCQPLFRRANKYLFKEDSQEIEPLINPHDGINPTANGGEIVLVKGKYRYYHYRQQNMDDDGWGCAYRSLQTLASWFILQGYIDDRSVPTFKEIQQCLVDIGDKPSSFVGSKQWIGSTEVNFVLNTLLNVTCKILYVSSGEELATKGPELVNHFKTNGTPIMIGGGVLAHTILGVDYNSQTGNLKFLILDPHYTGSDDLKTIQSKGWCGWKGADFWDKASYYNMCLPQVTGDI